eukprot:TRINITY_DN8782_c0_g2_i1.p1 TRINITY_DN8782_c0_g2~~TRINITY_DN8782_c0_g2_i1.p1  ORF type:complete len:238 (-),score=45.21 TRINITY_DN8782_c0_g2_i1:42-755(-)
MGGRQIYAKGMRNEVAVGFDTHNRLWGAMNGVDNLRRNDLGGDIHENNPSEELHLFLPNSSSSPDDKDISRFYGYPYCWTEYSLGNKSLGRGTKWVHPDFIDDERYSDAWCRDVNNVEPAKYSLEPHTAPLDILFLNMTTWGPDWDENALISYHGSWNKKDSEKSRVTRLKFSGEEGDTISEEVFLSFPKGAKTRVVGLAKGKCSMFSTTGNEECVFITSDASNEILVVSMKPKIIE